jgi:hypothetical protein
MEVKQPGPILAELMHRSMSQKLVAGASSLPSLTAQVRMLIDRYLCPTLLATKQVFDFLVFLA